MNHTDINCSSESGQTYPEGIYRERLEVYRREAHLFTGVGESIAGRSAIALYGLSPKEMPRPVGSGVLFKCGEKLFVLTAAQVADEFKSRPILITKGEGLVPLLGYMHLSSLPASGSRRDDLLDFAVMRVDGEIAEILSPLAMTVEDIHTPPTGMFHWRGYALVGFPARSFRVTGPELSCRASVIQTAELLPQRYGRLRVYPGTHIALEWFNTMYSRQGVVRSHSLAGMSGGGVWLVPAMMEELFPRTSAILATQADRHIHRSCEERIRFAGYQSSLPHGQDY